MFEKTKFLVSPNPFIHYNKGVAYRSYNIIIAASLAVFAGIFKFGLPALFVVCLSVSSAILWEYLFNLKPKKAFNRRWQCCNGRFYLFYVASCDCSLVVCHNRNFYSYYYRQANIWGVGGKSI